MTKEDDLSYGAWPHINKNLPTSLDYETSQEGSESVGEEYSERDLEVESDSDTESPIQYEVDTDKHDGVRGSVGDESQAYNSRHLESTPLDKKTKKVLFNPTVVYDDGVHTELVDNYSHTKGNNEDPDINDYRRTTRSISRNKINAGDANPLVIRARERKDIMKQYEDTLKKMEKAKIASRTRKRVRSSTTLVNAIDELDRPRMTRPTRLRVPLTYKEAYNSPQQTEWVAAIQKEYDSLNLKKTWETMTLPANRKALPCKWVFDIKYNPDGTIEKYKARLVIKGFKQIYGVDYDETFAPVARYESLKIVLAMSTILDMEVHQMDVCTAFLNGKLEEEIFMQEPEGYKSTTKTNQTCKLLRSIYGLKQAGRIWYQLLDGFLKENGFRRCHKEYCIYIQKDDSATTIIVVYVDDLTIASTNLERIVSIKKALSSRFEMKDLGEIAWLLKIKIQRDRANKTMTLTQRKYIEDLVERYDMTDATPDLTPQVANEKLMAPEPPMTPDQVRAQGYPYPELVGALLHLTRGTRPDIANAVRTLSKFLLNHNHVHWRAALRVLKYLKGTSHYGLVFDGTLDKKVSYQLFSDASFANTDENRKSISGYVVMMAGGPVSTKTTKQGNITISTTEAELVACSEACRESEWIWFLLEELGFKQTEPITVHCDNTAVVAIAKNPGNHNGTKHIEVRHLYIRHLVDQGRANIKYCWTEDMIADILTKAIPTRLFIKLRHMLGVRPVE
jgi:hypothetical protein